MMTSYDPFKHHRRSIRLQNYDYSQAGAYFITICVQKRQRLFGEITNGTMHLNSAGQMIEQWWHKLPTKFANLEIDEFVVMPDHIHGLVVLGSNNARGSYIDLPLRQEGNVKNPEIIQRGRHTGLPLHQEDQTRDVAAIPEIVQWLKTMSTNVYIRGVKEQNWLPFHGKVWQRGYFERVVRNDRELATIRQYIVDNPVCWAEHDPESDTFMGILQD